MKITGQPPINLNLTDSISNKKTETIRSNDVGSKSNVKFENHLEKPTESKEVKGTDNTNTSFGQGGHMLEEAFAADIRMAKMRLGLSSGNDEDTDKVDALPDANAELQHTQDFVAARSVDDSQGADTTDSNQGDISSDDNSGDGDGDVDQKQSGSNKRKKEEEEKKDKKRRFLFNSDEQGSQQGEQGSQEGEQGSQEGKQDEGGATEQDSEPEH